MASPRNPFKVLLAAAVVLLLVRSTADRLERYRHENRVEPLLVKLTDNRATERVAISPEGRYIVYSRRESEGLGCGCGRWRCTAAKCESLRRR
jgi:hypothetical protein